MGLGYIGEIMGDRSVKYSGPCKHATGNLFSLTNPDVGYAYCANNEGTEILYIASDEDDSGEFIS
jgi:hypothetical protein